MSRWPASRARRLLAVLLLLAVVPAFFLREPPPPWDPRQRIVFTPVPLPPPALARQHLGAFRLEGIWQLASPNVMFGSYSTMQRLADGQFLAIGDRGFALRFTPPGEPGGHPPLRMFDVVSRKVTAKVERDAESSAYDPATGRVWIGWEGINAIKRYDPDLLLEARKQPKAMRRWPQNGGAEAMIRLADGRFIVLCEDFTGWFENRLHEALLFPGDPTGSADPQRLTFSGPAEFSPTDMAQLPDGRVLILMRRAVWPFPLRFAGRIVIADPKAIRPGETWAAHDVAYLSSSLPVDNFEGIVAEPRPDGQVTVWLISDDNGAVTQRALLWKMVVDPARLR